jgi:predicted nucleic acid-binding Zn ribbon protein
MPTYIYKFIDTGETIEVHQAFTDDALTEAAHPATGEQMTVKKVFTPVGVSFKGGGFYKTDSRGGSSKSSSTATTSTDSTSSTSSSGESSKSESSKSESSNGSSKSGSKSESNGSSSSTPAASPAPKTPAKTSSGSD